MILIGRLGLKFSFPFITTNCSSLTPLIISILLPTETPVRTSIFLAIPFSNKYTTCFSPSGVRASLGIKSLLELFPTAISRENLVPDALRFFGKESLRVILIFLVPVLIFSEFTIPLILPLNFLLLL